MVSQLMVAPVALVFALAVSACGPGSPTATETPTPTPSATTETPTPEPTTAAPFVPTCENIVDPATISGFAAEGTLITPPAEFRAKMAAEGNALSSIFDAGGVVCQTGQGMGAFEIYAYGQLTTAEFAPLRAQFLADGVVETLAGVGVTYRVPSDMEGLPRVCYFEPGVVLVCGNDDDRIDEITAQVGLS